MTKQSPRQRKVEPSYEIDGFEIVRGAFKPVACETLIHFAAGAQRIVMPHRTIPAFETAMKTLAPLARSKLGNEISGLGSDYFSVSAGFGTHTDNDHVQALPGTFMSVWLALGDVTEENGPLVIGGKTVLCGQGDAVLLDGDIPHRSCAGRGPRPVALFTYIRKGAPFRPGSQQNRQEVPL